MKKKPQTIADLKFNWEITERSNFSSEIDATISKIEKLNPHLIGLKIKDDNYQFLFDKKEFSFKVNECFGRQVAEFFEYIGFRIRTFLQTTGHFSHFERIDDRTYRIHMKS